MESNPGTTNARNDFHPMCISFSFDEFCSPLIYRHGAGLSASIIDIRRRDRRAKEIVERICFAESTARVE
jgi:hypothetical protein